MLELDFLTMTSTSVRIERASTDWSGYGAPSSFAAAIVYPSVVQPETKRVKTSAGYEEVQGTAVYVLSSSARVSMSDRITLPDGRQPPILSVYHENDEQGQHHVEVFCG